MQQKPVLESQLLLLADLVRADVEYHFPCGEATVDMCAWTIESGQCQHCQRPEGCHYDLLLVPSDTAK